MASRQPKPGKCGAKTKQSPDGRSWYCTSPPMDGVTRCAIHGGKSPQVQAKRTEGKTRKLLHRMVTAIDADDIEANPLAAFDMEYRRTVAAVRFLNEKVSEILSGDEDALVWGEVEKKFIGAGEWPGIDVTERAGANMWLQLQHWEREHLEKLTKLYVVAKIGEGQLALKGRMVDAIDELLKLVAAGLGADPNSVEVRKIIDQSFESLGAKQAVRVIDG